MNNIGNNEKIRSIYDKISTFNPLCWTLDFSSVCDSVAVKMNGEASAPRDKKVVSKDEEYINGAIEVSKLNLYEGEIIAPEKDYIYGYQDLTFAEFCSYIYWRTLIRNKKTYNVPSGFLALYLIEIVNFVEAETYSSTLKLLEYIKQLSAPEPRNSRQVDKAIEEFVIVYGSVTDVHRYCDLSQFDYIFDDILIYRREHPYLLSRLSAMYYSQFKNSKIWENENQYLENNFAKYFYSIADFFEKQDIPFMELYVGKPKYFSLHKVYIKHILKEKVVAKEIVRDGVQLIKVFDAIAEKITKGYTDGTDENKGHIFIRQYIIKYILRLYEREMRTVLGYPKIKAELHITNALALKDQFAYRLFEVINTEDFKQVVSQVQNS